MTTDCERTARLIKKTGENVSWIWDSLIVPIGGRQTPQRPARGMEAAEIAVVGTRADMRGDEEPRSFYKTDIERVARLIASHSGSTLPRSRRVVEPQVMYSRARLSPLSIWAEEDSSVCNAKFAASIVRWAWVSMKPGAHRLLGEIDHLCTERSPPAIGRCQPRRIAMNRSPKQRTAPAIVTAVDGSRNAVPITTTAAPARAATA